MRKYRRNRIIIFLTFFLTVPLYSLDYSDFYSTLSDVFAGFIDPNAGMTIFPTLNIPAGGRAESMGTAFTGLADDIGYIEYNPAASSVLNSTEAAAFHNAWIADASVETLAFTSRSGNFGYGAMLKCLYVSFTEYGAAGGQRLSSGYYSETIGILNVSYNFFSGYTFKGIAVGMNLKGAYRSVPDYADNETETITALSGLSQSGAAVMADIGVQLRFNLLKFYSAREPNMNVGIALSNAGLAYTGFGTEEGSVRDDSLPARAALGLSYKPIRPLIITLEFRKPFNLYDISLSEQWSAGAGTAVQITDFFSVQSGFFLSSGNPRFSLGSSFLHKGLLFNINYTLDLTSSLNPFNRFTMSVKMDLGDKGRESLQAEVDQLYSEGLRLYAEGNFENAVISWKAALKLNPGFDPAKQGLEAAENAVLLQKTILEIQSLD